MSSNDISQDDGFNHHNEISLRDRRHDSLRKRSKSSPMRAESPSLGAADSSTAPVSRKQHPLRLEAATRPSDNKRDQLASSPAVGKGRYPPQTPPAPLTSKSRNRAVTNNVNNSATRKSPHLNSQSGGPRRPLQASSSTSNRQVSTPLKKFSSSTPPSTRARSSSTSLLSNSIQHDWDENSKPPWLEESPSYLYKSDIENIQPGSLADIARHAQGRSQTSQGADGDASLLGDTSVRSWDDVILPAVAKQIRAQQILEMQKNAQQCEDGKDDNLLVTHWNADGTPRKWQRLQPRSAGIAGTPASPNDSQVTEDSLAVISDGKPEGNSAGRFKTLSSGTLRQQEHQEPSSSSSSQQHLSVEQRLSQRSANSPTDSAGGKASSNMHNLEGREVWERNRDTSFNRPFSNEHSLLQTQEMNLSTNPQKPEPYHRDPDSGALRLQEGQMHQSQEQEQERETDTHKGGCCKCTIM